MTSDNTDCIARIVRDLLPAQQRALLWLPADGSVRVWQGDEDDRLAHIALRQLGLGKIAATHPNGTLGRAATNRGRAVRAALEARRDG